MDFMRSFIESYLPPNYSEQGYVIDDLIIWVHYLMLVLFVGWGIYFVYTLFRFRASKNTKANYKGVTSHYSTYVEFGIIAVEVALLFGLAIPNWQKLKLDVPKPQEVAVEDSTIEIREKLMSDMNIDGELETFFPSNEVTQDMQVINIIAQTFNYNIHYPGPDGKFGPRHIDLIDDGSENYIGLDLNHEHSKDDIMLQDLLILEVDKPVLIYLTSKDVIHSFFLPEFRVKQDAIPGQKVSIFFTPTKTTKEFLDEMPSNSNEFKCYSKLEFDISNIDDLLLLTNNTLDIFNDIPNYIEEYYKLEQTDGVDSAFAKIISMIEEKLDIIEKDGQNFAHNSNFITKESCEEKGHIWKPLNPSFSLWDWIADPENLDYDFLDFNGNGKAEPDFNRADRYEGLPHVYGRDTFQMGCAQLCGSGHATMNKGDVFIVSKENYQQWYLGQMWAKNSITPSEDDEWGDEW